jgi:hypothetical protein
MAGSFKPTLSLHRLSLFPFIATYSAFQDGAGPCPVQKRELTSAC